jgi:hypothetical protein
MPATDDRPHFFDFSRWRSLPGPVLILAPLLVLRRRSASPGTGRRRALGYFGLIGLSFMFLEIAFMHRFTLTTAHPVYAVAVVLAGFLVLAGLGGAVSARLPPERFSL